MTTRSWQGLDLDGPVHGPHLPETWQRPAADQGVKPAESAKRRRTRVRRPPLTSILKQAAKAGREVEKVKVTKDGYTIRFTTGKPDETEPDDNRNDDEWNGVLLK
jgi:hypothetical protein